MLAWLNQNAAAVQALASVLSVIATVVLLGVTRQYVALTQELARSRPRRRAVGRSGGAQPAQPEERQLPFSRPDNASSRTFDCEVGLPMPSIGCEARPDRSSRTVRDRWPPDSSAAEGR